jgi:hypothetical protein
MIAGGRIRGSNTGSSGRRTPPRPKNSCTMGSLQGLRTANRGKIEVVYPQGSESPRPFVRLFIKSACQQASCSKPNNIDV